MYKNLKILDTQDRKLKLNPTDNYIFARKQLQLPLALGELSKACRTFPVLFIQTEQGDYSAIALTSINGKSNIYIDNNGHYRNGAYLPEYIKNYPFVYVQEQEQLLVAYEVGIKQLSTKSGEPLFQEDGEPTPLLTEKLTQLSQYQQGLTDFSNIISSLNDAGVLITANEPLQVGEYQIDLKGFMYVNEDALHQLDDKHLLALVRSGAYKTAITQLTSLHNLSQLLANETL